MHCKRDRCGHEADPKSGNWRLCTAHFEERKERRRRGQMIPRCAHPGCNQQVNSVSNLCGVHWRWLLDERDRLQAEQDRLEAEMDFKERLRGRIRAASSLDELKDVLIDCVDYWGSDG